jgi:hypothetical protein
MGMFPKTLRADVETLSSSSLGSIFSAPEGNLLEGRGKVQTEPATYSAIRAIPEMMPAWTQCASAAASSRRRQLGNEWWAGMDAEIRIVDGADGDLAVLGQWLQGEEELRGRIRAVRGEPGETELGTAVELLTVALGTGGAGTVLASSLKTWLLTRRTTAKIVVKSAGRSVTLDIHNADDVAPLLEQILKVSQDG